VLTPMERRSVEQEFQVVLAGLSNPRGLVTVIFGTEATDILLDLPPSVNDWNEFANRIVGKCVASRWSCDPSLMQMLLAYLVGTKGYGGLQPILNRVIARQDPNPSPYASHWLMGVNPFIDRIDLRAHAQILMDGIARPILRIVAPEGAFGKTYTQTFFTHLEEKLVDAHIVTERLSPGTGPSYRPTDLASALIAQMGVTEKPPELQTTLYAKTLCMWVLSNMMAKSGTWFIVLDGFGQRPLNPDVAQMIDILASMLSGARYRLKIRLVLIDYPDSLSEVPRADILEEVLCRPDQIRQEDLAPCIKEWDDMRRIEHGKGMELAEQAQLAAGIVQKAPANGKPRLESLYGQLQDLMKFPAPA